MSITRKFLKAMGITDEQVESIIDAHTETTDALKLDVEKYKADVATLATVQKDLDEANAKLETAGGGEIQAQLDALQAKYDTDTGALTEKLADRDHSDAITRTVTGAGIKFSSKAAEKAFIAELKEKKLEIKDGVLDGFDGFHKAQMEADPAAFMGDKPAPFIKSIGKGEPPAPTGRAAAFAQNYGAQFMPAENKKE